MGLLKKVQDAVADMVEDAAVREDTALGGVGAVPLNFIRESLDNQNTELTPGVKKLKKLKNKKGKKGCPLEKGSRCGSRHGGRCCGKGRYCSRWGWCGTSKLHKRKSRQSKYRIDTWGKKLKKLKNKKGKKGCPLEKGSRCGSRHEGRCCSMWGWCGTSSLHKRKSSQSKYRIDTWPKPKPVGCPLEKGSRCGSRHGGRCCGKGRYCSMWGWCG